MKKAFYPALAIIVLLLVQLYRQEREIATLRQEIADARSARTAARIREVRVAAPDRTASASPASDQPFEDALAPWIEKARALSAYLDKHPKLRILQMDSLKAEDWLDVTKGTDLKTDADCREALAKLRGIARRTTAKALSNALGQEMAANGGQVPSDPSVLAPFLPPGLDPGLLGQLQLNPSGSVAGLRTQQQFFMVDTPVDLWDATLFYSNDGNWGLRSATAPGQQAVANAITLYTQTNGTPPTDPSQLAAYAGIGSISGPNLNEIFQALTTPYP